MSWFGLNRPKAIASGKDLPPSGRNPTDDFWFTPIGGGKGVAHVSHETALRLTTVTACVRTIAEALGQLPLHMFEREMNGDKTRLVDHPLTEILQIQANDEQSAVEFREMMSAWAVLRGTAIAEIIPGARGAVGQLVPLDPRRVRPVEVRDGQNRRRWQFVYSENGAPDRRLLRDEVFIVRGITMGPDHICGLDPITVEANSIAAQLAAVDYAGRFLANDARPSAVIYHPGHFRSDEERNVFRRAWDRFTGSGRHRTAVLEYGMQYEPVSVTPEQAQFLETRRYQDVDICRIFRVQPHKVGILDRATWNNIEQQSLEFVIDTLGPWLVRWEQAISRDLIADRRMRFAEHNVAGLLRGDIESRFAAYSVARNWGWMNVNEIRRLENLNSIGPDGDVYLQPLNMREAGPGDGEPRERTTRSPRQVPDSANAAAMTQRGSGLWVPKIAA